MTLLQRNYLLDKNPEAKKKIINSENFKSFINFYDYLFKQRKVIKIPQQALYFFIKIIKFLIKYKFLYESQDSQIDTESEDKIIVKALDLINNFLLENISEVLVGKNFIRLPGLDIILEIVFLVLLYHNDLKSSQIIQEKDSEGKFAYEHNKKKKYNVVIESAKIFANTIAIRNLLKNWGKKDKTGINPINIFYNFRNPNNINANSSDFEEYYESWIFNYLGRRIFGMLIPNWLKCKKINIYLFNLF